MAVNLSPVGGVAAQFFDNSGNVLTGGKIYTYLAGTTTPAVAYTTSAGNIPWSNPIVLDASGRVSGSGEIWLSDGITYKFIIKDSNDVLIATYDNIIGINSNFVNFINQQEIQTATAGQTVFNLATVQYQPGTNSLSVFVDGVNQYGPGAQYAYVETDQDTVTFVNGLHVGALVKFTTSQINTAAATDAQQVSYTAPFANAVPTNVEAKLAQYISVKDFGAVGNGVADDLTAINNAISYANSIGGATVYFPSGTYKITNQIQYLGLVNLVGEDMANTTLLWYPPTNLAGSIINTANRNLNRVTFKNLRFTKDASISANVTGILGGSTLVNYNSAIACFENLHFDSIAYGIRGNAEPTGVGIFDSYFKNIWCSSCFYGLWLYGSSNRVDHPRMTLCDTGIALDYLNSESFDGMTVTGGTFVQNNYDVGVLSASGIRPTAFIGTWYETAANGIINIPNANTPVMNLDFIGCMLSVSSTVNMFNVANALGTVSVDRCTLISGGVGKAQNFVRPTANGGRLIVKDCQKYDSSGVASYVSDYGYFEVVKGGTNQSIAPATPTIVTWSTATLDLGGNFNNANDSFDVTAPGIYLVSAQIAFAAHTVSTNINKVSIYKNGSQVKTALGASNSSAQTTVNVSALVSCNASDTLQIWVEQGNGVAIDVLGANDLTYFDVQFVGPK